MSEIPHILSARQFSAKQLENIFKLSDEMRDASRTRKGCRELAGSHIGSVVATLFYEPSTRTRWRFESAAQRLGASVIGTEDAGKYSSAAKGETLKDTIRTVDRYAHTIVLRHHTTGAADEAASVSRVPIINAGDGKGEHPTQALLDAYTINTKKGRLNDLRVVIGGDLAHGRTARSLAQMLSMYPNNRITFVSTPELQMGKDITDHLAQQQTGFTETDNVFSAVGEADVVYWTRLQRERHDGADLQSGFVIDQAVMQAMSKDAIVMHPLPRVDEIATTVDDDPRAVYFDQVENGLYVSMALVDMVLTAATRD